MPKAAQLVNKFIQIMVEEEKMTLNNELDRNKFVNFPFWSKEDDYSSQLNGLTSFNWSVGKQVEKSFHS